MSDLPCTQYNTNKTQSITKHKSHSTSSSRASGGQPSAGGACQASRAAEAELLAAGVGASPHTLMHASSGDRLQASSPLLPDREPTG